MKSIIKSTKMLALKSKTTKRSVVVKLDNASIRIGLTYNGEYQIASSQLDKIFSDCDLTALISGFEGQKGRNFSLEEFEEYLDVLTERGILKAVRINNELMDQSLQNRANLALEAQSKIDLSSFANIAGIATFVIRLKEHLNQDSLESLLQVFLSILS